MEPKLLLIRDTILIKTLSGKSTPQHCRDSKATAGRTYVHA